MKTIERWAKVNDCGYWVSDQGRVFSEPRQVRFEVAGKEFFRQKKGRYLGLNICPNGYQRVNIQGKIILVHALVSKFFFCDYDKINNTVNHKDLEKTNNCFTNLEVISRKDNTKHAWENGALDHTLKKVMCNETQQTFTSLHDAAKYFNMAVGNLCSHLKGRQKTFGGKTFVYAE